MDEVTLKIPKEFISELEDLCISNSIDYQTRKRDLLESNTLNSELDLFALITFAIGSSAFWVGLYNILKEMTKKTKIEIKIESKDYKLTIKSGSKNIKGIIKELAQHLGNEKLEIDDD